MIVDAPIKALDLTAYGIRNVVQIIHNPSYAQLFEAETDPSLQGYERGVVTDSGTVAVDTGIFTGRSPKDKYIVCDDATRDTMWWTSEKAKNDNKPISQDVWNDLKKSVTDELSGKTLYVVDTFCGTNPDTRLKVRFIVEVAWQAHFVTNMFLRPTQEELEEFEPDFVVMNG